MIKEIKINASKVEIIRDPGTSMVDLGAAIRKTILFDDSFIVLMGSDKKYGDLNILKISEDGEILWQVERPDVEGTSTQFTEMNLLNGDLWAYSSYGFTFKIDLATGKLLDKVFSK